MWQGWTGEYADVSADALHFVFGELDVPALHQREGTIGDVHLTLAILGTSHQITVTVNDLPIYIETLSCAAEGISDESMLTPEEAIPVALNYGAQLQYQVIPIEPGQHNRYQQAADASALSAGLTFPSPDGDAYTLLWANMDSGTLVFDTVHLYPNEGRVVESHTELPLYLTD